MRCCDSHGTGVCHRRAWIVSAYPPWAETAQHSAGSGTAIVMSAPDQDRARGTCAFPAINLGPALSAGCGQGPILPGLQEGEALKHRRRSGPADTQEMQAGRQCGEVAGHHMGAEVVRPGTELENFPAENVTHRGAQVGRGRQRAGECERGVAGGPETGREGCGCAERSWKCHHAEVGNVGVSQLHGRNADCHAGRNVRGFRLTSASPLPCSWSSRYPMLPETN